MTALKAERELILGDRVYAGVDACLARRDYDAALSTLDATRKNYLDGRADGALRDSGGRDAGGYTPSRPGLEGTPGGRGREPRPLLARLPRRGRANPPGFGGQTLVGDVPIRLGSVVKSWA